VVCSSGGSGDDGDDDGGDSDGDDSRYVMVMVVMVGL
jgi:hypothetical protein